MRGGEGKQVEVWRSSDEGEGKSMDVEGDG